MGYFDQTNSRSRRRFILQILDCISLPKEGGIGPQGPRLPPAHKKNYAKIRKLCNTGLKMQAVSFNWENEPFSIKNVTSQKITGRKVCGREEDSFPGRTISWRRGGGMYDYGWGKLMEAVTKPFKSSKKMCSECRVAFMPSNNNLRRAGRTPAAKEVVHHAVC